MNRSHEMVIRFLIVLSSVLVAFPAFAEAPRLPIGWTLARTDEAGRAIDCFFRISSKPIAIDDQHKHRIEEVYHPVRIEKDQLPLWSKTYAEKSTLRPCSNAREGYASGSVIAGGKDFLRDNNVLIDGARFTKRIFDVSDVLEKGGEYSFYFKESIYDKPPNLGGWVCLPRIDETAIIVFMRFRDVDVDVQYAVLKQVFPVKQGVCSLVSEKK